MLCSTVSSNWGISCSEKYASALIEWSSCASVVMPFFTYSAPDGTPLCIFFARGEGNKHMGRNLRTCRKRKGKEQRWFGTIGPEPLFLFVILGIMATRSILVLHGYVISRSFQISELYSKFQGRYSQNASIFSKRVRDIKLSLTVTYIAM